MTDLTIEPAHLEEAFLEFYEGEDAGELGPNGDGGSARPPAPAAAPTARGRLDEP